MENITTQQVLGVITLLLVLFLVAPNILRLNMARGTALRNVVLWLLIFVGLVWAYQLTHPSDVVADGAVTSTQPASEPTPMGADTE